MIFGQLLTNTDRAHDDQGPQYPREHRQEVLRVEVRWWSAVEQQVFDAAAAYGRPPAAWFAAHSTPAFYRRVAVNRNPPRWCGGGDQALGDPARGLVASRRVEGIACPARILHHIGGHSAVPESGGSYPKRRINVDCRRHWAARAMRSPRSMADQSLNTSARARRRRRWGYA